MNIQLDLFDPNKHILCDLFAAYFDARKNKRNTTNQLKFEQNYESNLIELYNHIINRTYSINPSICFINFDPVQREIFAADFRDRVVHHLIYNYISPIFEHVFIHDAYSCRKGKGTSYGINRLQHFIRSCTENYQQEAFILKLDIKGYFMAMNRQLLFEKVIKTMTKYLQKKDSPPVFEIQKKLFETLVYLIEKVIFNDPTDNCLIKGRKSDWNGLPPSKSLFKADDNCGLPIGNLTSQLFGNVYMNDFDHYVKCQLKCKYYGRYVDDFVIIHRDKYFLKSLLPQLSAYLQNNFHLTLHPNKIYLQPLEKGVKFLGAIIKPHRTYIGNRTKGNFFRKLKTWNRSVEQSTDNSLSKLELQKFISSINSYLGISLQFDTWKLRKKMIIENMSPHFWKYVYLCNNRKLKLKKTQNLLDNNIKDKNYASNLSNHNQ